LPPNRPLKRRGPKDHLATGKESVGPKFKVYARKSQESQSKKKPVDEGKKNQKRNGGSDREIDHTAKREKGKISLGEKITGTAGKPGEPSQEEKSRSIHHKKQRRTRENDKSQKKPVTAKRKLHPKWGRGPRF